MSLESYPAFAADRFRELARARNLSLGDPLFALSVTGSTNDDALNAARAGAEHGATFLTDQQTSGRGRRGQRWSSPPGENLTFSVLLRPAFAPERAGPFTLAVGLAIRDVAARCIAAPVGIKWPNDLLVNGRKLAGILVESHIQLGKLSALVVGIGLNVHMRALPPEIAGIATSLALEGAHEIEREHLLCDVLEALAARLASYETLGLSALLPELLAHDALRGRRVRTESASGIARGIEVSGGLLVEDPSGSLVSVVSGGVELLDS
ncbi:MAG TPA: biotin--[acetyl-CoA-carboxylase] ligase [Polyangiaceae bacterium]|nr:biotin--[acetyl-CoA-carboxylase] ligase [Polyangiaceae bacterium]